MTRSFVFLHNASVSGIDAPSNLTYKGCCFHLMLASLVSIPSGKAIRIDDQRMIFPRSLLFLTGTLITISISFKKKEKKKKLSRTYITRSFKRFGTKKGSEPNFPNLFLLALATTTSSTHQCHIARA